MGRGTDGDVVTMPPRRAHQARVQLNTRIPIDLETLLRRFVTDHDTTMQDCVHLALTEFLAARGYPGVAA